MSATPIETLRDRLKGFLVLVRAKLLAGGADLDRLAQLRRLSDVRIRQFSVGKPQVTTTDLGRLLSDPKIGRFDALAAETGLLLPTHLVLPLTPLGEEMGYVVEASLSLQILGVETVQTLLKQAVTKNGPIAEGPPVAGQAPASPAPKPLPPAVARLLGSARELWTPPAGALKAIDLLQSPNRPPDLACAEIERAPALSALCLKIVNASSVAQGTRISSVKGAVVALGYPAMRRAVSTSALFSILGSPSEDFWRHSLRVAHGSSLASRAARLGSAEDHFAAGLLHEVGGLAAAQFAKGGVEGTASPEIAACVLERWGFTPAIAEAARHHQDREEQLEELPLPREAIVVAAMCRLTRDEADANAWSGLLRLPASRIQELRLQANQLADAGLKEILS